MALFDPAIAIVLKHEGGFTNNPLDKGGPTNFGITHTTLSEYLGVPATTEMVEGMSEELAKEIYKKLFWDRLDLDTLASQQLAVVLLDIAVVQGLSKLVLNVQKLLGIYPDGIVGPVTLNKLREILIPQELALAIVKEAQLSFVSLTLYNSSQLQFLPGWIRRTQDLLDLLI